MKTLTALLLGIGSVFSIFHPAKAAPNLSDYENLRRDMHSIGKDFQQAIKHAKRHE